MLSIEEIKKYLKSFLEDINSVILCNSIFFRGATDYNPIPTRLSRYPYANSKATLVDFRHAAGLPTRLLILGEYISNLLNDPDNEECRNSFMNIKDYMLVMFAELYKYKYNYKDDKEKKKISAILDKYSSPDYYAFPEDDFTTPYPCPSGGYKAALSHSEVYITRGIERCQDYLKGSPIMQYSSINKMYFIFSNFKTAICSSLYTGTLTYKERYELARYIGTLWDDCELTYYKIMLLEPYEEMEVDKNSYRRRIRIKSNIDQSLLEEQLKRITQIDKLLSSLVEDIDDKFIYYYNSNLAKTLIECKSYFKNDLSKQKMILTLSDEFKEVKAYLYDYDFCLTDDQIKVYCESLESIATNFKKQCVLLNQNADIIDSTNLQQQVLEIKINEISEKLSNLKDEIYERSINQCGKILNGKIQEVQEEQKIDNKVQEEQKKVQEEQKIDNKVQEEQKKVQEEQKIDNNNNGLQSTVKKTEVQMPNRSPNGNILLTFWLSICKFFNDFFSRPTLSKQDQLHTNRNTLFGDSNENSNDNNKPESLTINSCHCNPNN